MNSAAQVREWLDARTEELANLLERLVVVNTENPPGRGLGDCAVVLAEAMGELDFGPGGDRAGSSPPALPGSPVIASVRGSAG